MKKYYDKEHFIDYNRITEQIYIGTNACCLAHFNPYLRKKEKISADISLEAERVDTPYGIKFYTWLPTVDHTPPMQDQLDVGVKTIETLIVQKRRIYIHCKNGHGRAPTLVAAYFISQGASVKDAIAKIKKKRSSMHLEPSQRKALETFAKKHDKAT